MNDDSLVAAVVQLQAAISAKQRAQQQIDLGQNQVASGKSALVQANADLSAARQAVRDAVSAP